MESWKVTGRLIGSKDVSEAPYRFATQEEAEDYASLAAGLGISGLEVKCEPCDKPVNAEFKRLAKKGA